MVSWPPAHPYRASMLRVRLHSHPASDNSLELPPVSSPRPIHCRWWCDKTVAWVSWALFFSFFWLCLGSIILATTLSDNSHRLGPVPKPHTTGLKVPRVAAAANIAYLVCTYVWRSPYMCVYRDCKWDAAAIDGESCVTVLKHCSSVSVSDTPYRFKG